MLANDLCLPRVIIAGFIVLLGGIYIMQNIAFIFPGQGSQSLHMMNDMLSHAIVQDTFHIAQDTLGIDFLAMLTESTPHNINLTINTQPLMLTAGYATYLLAKQHGITPSILAGHSLGEWTALVASEVLIFSDALHLVQHRARLMQEAVINDTMMAAILGLDYASVDAICIQSALTTNAVVGVANINSPQQIVIAGDKIAVMATINELKKHGAKKVQELPISVPSHCLLMQNAAKQLAKIMQNTTFAQPKIKIIHNYDAKSHDDIVTIKDVLLKQIYSPVKWMQSIEQIFDLGITNFVECGPNKILSNLNKRINSQITSYTLHNQDELAQIFNIK